MMGLPIPDHLTSAVERFRYHRRVSIAPPWPEIFTQDSEQKQSVDEAKRTYRAMVRSYTECGCELIELPRAPVGARLEFILDSGVSSESELAAARSSHGTPWAPPR